MNIGILRFGLRVLRGFYRVKAHLSGSGCEDRDCPDRVYGHRGREVGNAQPKHSVLPEIADG